MVDIHGRKCIREVGGMSEFNSSIDTYEHDTLFYNYDGTAWATTALYYDSNLPNSYLDDIDAFDSNNEKNISVGTFTATSLASGTWYYYDIACSPTGSSGSYYKIQAQEGYWLGATFSAWNTFQETTSTLIPFKSPFIAPETARDAKLEWENNGSMSSIADYTYVGDWGSGAISSTSDVDYWDFDVSTGAYYNFVLKMPQNLDLEIQVYNNSGGLVGGSYNGVSSDEWVQLYLSPGHYYVKIYGYNGHYNSLSNYGLLIY